jgi:hypothetical protein
MKTKPSDSRRDYRFSCSPAERNACRVLAIMSSPTTSDGAKHERKGFSYLTLIQCRNRREPDTLVSRTVRSNNEIFDLEIGLTHHATLLPSARRPWRQNKVQWHRVDNPDPGFLGFHASVCRISPGGILVVRFK